MKNFRTNTVAEAGHDVDASAEREAANMRPMRVVTISRPKPKRQACKGKKRRRGPARFQWRDAA